MIKVPMMCLTNAPRCEGVWHSYYCGFPERQPDEEDFVCRECTLQNRLENYFSWLVMCKHKEGEYERATRRFLPC